MRPKYTYGILLQSYYIKILFTAPIRVHHHLFQILLIVIVSL